MVDVKYRTSASASGGGREGHAKTADGKVDVQLSVPKELGGGGGAGTNPEQLFATGYSACFLGAMRHVAGQEKIKLPDVTSVSVEVGIGPRDDGTGFGLEVAITAQGAGHGPRSSRGAGREGGRRLSVQPCHQGQHQAQRDRGLSRRQTSVSLLARSSTAGRVIDRSGPSMYALSYGSSHPADADHGCCRREGWWRSRRTT